MGYLTVAADIRRGLGQKCQLLARTAVAGQGHRPSVVFWTPNSRIRSGGTGRSGGRAFGMGRRALRQALVNSHQVWNHRRLAQQVGPNVVLAAHYWWTIIWDGESVLALEMVRA